MAVVGRLPNDAEKETNSLNLKGPLLQTAGLKTPHLASIRSIVSCPMLSGDHRPVNSKSLMARYPSGQRVVPCKGLPT